MADDGLLIDVKNLVKDYPIGDSVYHALRGVSLKVRRGEFLAIMGPSGSGKSTLLHLLGCLDTPTSGEYSLAGTPVHKLSADELAELRNREIGFIFQMFFLLPALHALENVELPLIYAKVPPAERHKKAHGGPPVPQAWRPTPPTGPTSSRAASASRSPSPGPWSTGPPSSWRTSPRATWTA